MPDKFVVRLAVPEDAGALLEIYAPFVVSPDRNISDVSFEYTEPSVEEFAGRIKGIGAGFPYLVCEEDGRAVGYVYAHPYITRAAYQWGAEVTIYLAPEAQGRGLGRILYDALEKLLLLQGIVTLYACVTASNIHSVKMHEACGFKIVGTFKKTGYKHGHWLDMVWLEKVIADHPAAPKLVKSIKKLPESEIAAILKAAAEAAAAHAAPKPSA